MKFLVLAFCLVAVSSVSQAQDQTIESGIRTATSFISQTFGKELPVDQIVDSVKNFRVIKSSGEYFIQ
jgi:hypothetical protein